MGRRLSLALLCALLPLAAGRAGAQLSAGASSTSGSSCSSDDGDGFCGFSSALTANTGSTVASRYAWNVNSDIGILSTRDSSGTARHTLSFNAVAPGTYVLNVAQQFIGDLNRISDAPGCDGAADISGVSGSQTGGTISGGSLNVADPGSLASGGSTTSLPFSQTANATITRASNGVAGAHSLVFTWTGSTRSNSCEAAVRLGEQNGTTTGCDACGYAGSPSRTQASDGHFVTVSFTSICGNSFVDTSFGEQCDEGAANGSASSCCTSACKLRPNGTVCRSAAGACDAAEACNGVFGSCPADAKLPSGQGCRAIAGICDVPEFCNGSSNNCPADAKAPSGTVCRAGSAGEVCDLNEVCNGSATTCPADAVKPSGTVCRASAGGCDIAETCNGTTKFCLADFFQPGGTQCRAASGACDVAELCPGGSPNCPANGFASSSTVCRASAGACDLTETCSGSGPNCPADAKSTAQCRAVAGTCDVAESCNGVSNTCPTDTFVASGTQCRAAASICDLAEQCTGTAATCPADAFKPGTVECRAAAGVCDTAENCTGSGAACPVDGKSTALCRGAADVCDAAESCDGAGNDCPTDQAAPSGTACRAAAGVCDAAEVCDGVAIACPADAFQASGTPCPDGEFCNGDEICSGGGTCIDAADPCSFLCNESADACMTSGCNGTPLSGCRTAAKSLLLIKNKLDSNKDKLVWKWINGQSTSQTDFANPETTANYAVCIYAGTSGALVGEIAVPPSAALWDPLGSKGYKYLDIASAQDGVQKITLKGSSIGKSKALVKGRGAALPDPIDAMSLPLPVRTQMVNYGTNICFESTFTTQQKNTTSMFKAKAP